MPPIKKHFQIPLTHLPSFAPNYKKMPPIKKKVQIPLTHLPLFAPNYKKKMPPIKKTFSNSTNTFAPIVKNAPN